MDSSNKRYFFILGKNPTLSIAEILSVLSTMDIKVTIDKYSEEVLIVTLSAEIKETDVQKKLGGTVKIGKVVSMLNLSESQSDLETALSKESLFTHFFSEKIHKIHFGLSLYFLDKDNSLIKNYKKLLMNLSKHIKNEVKKTDHSIGFVQIKERFLSSVSVVKNELLLSGAEIVLIIDKENIVLGKTESVQEFEDYSWRDYGRPERDPKRGMLPPKLAKIMINLCRPTAQSILLDPFCGSGTVVQEAIVLGIKQIIGSDISKEAIEDTKKNIEWLKRYLDNTEEVSIKLFKEDARSLDKCIALNSVDVIVTEPYLGPPLRGFINKQQAEEIYKSLKPLYLQSFSVFNKLLKSGAHIAIVIPAFKINNETVSMHIQKELDKYGFTQISLFPEDLNLALPEYTNEQTILYGTHGHFLLREVLVLTKK